MEGRLVEAMRNAVIERVKVDPAAVAITYSALFEGNTLQDVTPNPFAKQKWTLPPFRKVTNAEGKVIAEFFPDKKL